MSTLGSASIKLTLDRSRFDSDLTKLQQQDVGQIAYCIKLDTKDFERQIKGLSKLVLPVFIPLEIDTKAFDQQIKKLNSSIDPIKIDLAPNVKDFQEKLRRLSKITPVTVDIKVDEGKVRQQFETIGKYAAEGFAQGFSGAEDAGKSAVDSMVRSVNKQLGIQSPSKVFREIGKYAIAGLMQGLDSVDESKLKGVTNKIESYFKKSKIKINVDIDASGISGKAKVQAATPTEKPTDFAKNITKSIEDGFQKAKPKASFLGAIFGGIGSLITIPLAATLRGAFEGIGTPLGLQLGTGVTKAIQSTLGQSIGSLELISQRAVEKSLQAIPAAQSAIVEVIKANPIGSAIAKQLELLQRTLELYSINLSPQKAVKSLASDEERAVASSSATFESQQSQFKSRKKAKASASNEFVSIVEQKGEVDKISELIKKKEQELTAKAKKLQSAQNAIASLQTKQEKLASLPAPKTQAEAKSRITTDTSLKKQITEMSQVLAGGSLSIEQDIKDIQSLKDAKNAYLEKLNKQIKILAELGIEKDLSGETAEILKGIDVFEQLLSAQKAVAEVQKNIKTNAKTSVSIRPKKLQKLEGQAKDARTNLEQAIASPDATPEQVQKLQKRAAAANKALDLYKLEISDPAKEIEKLNQKLANGNAALAKNIQELQARLTKAIPALFRDASQEVVKVENLNEIPQASPSKGQLAIERQALLSEQETRKTLELKKLKEQKAESTKNLPKLYVDAVQSVSRIVTGKNLEREKIPNIVPSAEVAGRGDYSAQSNTYRIRPDLYKQLQTGDINQVADEAIGNIVHEIFHAFQHSFGKAIADNTGQLAVDITPTPEELLKVGDKVESSVAIQPDERKPLSRQLETGANVFQLRNTDRVRDELKRNQLKGQALSLGGVAGSKIGLTDVNKLIDSVSSFLQEAKNLGIDVSKQKAKYIGIIKDIRAKADAVGARSVNIDSLPTIEIEGIVKQYQEILKAVDDAKTEVLGLTVDLPQTQALTQELVIQNSKPQLARVAKELGVKGASGKDKQGLADAIVGTGASPELIRSKLPAPTVATEKILALSQKLLQLPSQELEKSTKYAVNNFGLKLKAIAKNPDDKNKVIELQKVLAEIDELEKTYIAAKVKTLDESLQNVFQGRILGLQKQRVAATYQLKPLVGKNLATQATTAGATQSVTDAEISTQRKNLDQLSPILPTPSPPPNFNLPIATKTKLAMRANYDIWDSTSKLPPPPPGFYSPIGKSKTTLPPPPPGFNLPIGNKSTRLTPPAPPDFNLPVKVKQLVDKVKDSGELFKIVTDIQKDQAKNLNQKLKEYDRIIKIYDDLEAEKVKQNQALDDKFDPEKVDRQRQTIGQRAKLSAKLERKYGMEGLAPEILPERINDLGEVGKSPSILQGIKDIFKSLNNSVAKRVKKRAAQLAIEVDTAIAPGLEGQAIAAEQRGDKVEQKQYQKLARQSRAATKGIAKILESPGDLTDKQVKQLDRLTSQLEKVYDAIGRPLPSQGFLESIGLGASGAIGLVKSLGGVLKGFLAFQIGMWAQNFFGSIAQESFKAFVELDKLKTALNFASGGSAGGAQNLAFVKKTVEDLKVPLKASTEGFVQLAAAAKGSALEGKQSRELFLGISQASTVLSLSADDTQGAILALSQMISKGKVSAEELRQQLGERLPGAMGIASRALGVTETEFQRLLDSGQILSQDFLPKFAKQLQSEFGDAAKDAAGNAQSAIFGVQNAFLGLQQGIGEGVAPAATAGLNGLSVILKGLASVAKELGFILLGVTAALSIKMVGALQAVIAQLIATRFATGTLSGGMAQLGQTINNSFSVKLTAGIFAVLEVINLLNQAVNTELTQSFEKAAASAKRAAEESAKAFQKATPNQPITTEPESSSGVGRFLDKYLIGALNFGNDNFRVGNLLVPGGMAAGDKLKTYGESERDRVTQNTADIAGSNTDFLSSAKLRLTQLKTGSGDIGQLPTIDATLRDAEQQRQILQAQSKRNFTDKGLAIPADDKRRLEAQNLRITDLNNQRSEIAKPFTLDLSRTDQQINGLKAQIESLKSPEGIAAVGGDEAALKLTEDLKASMERLKQFKAEAETTLASLRVDPVLAFSQALRQLNLTLAEGQEKNKENLSKRKLANTKEAIAGFSSNKLASKRLALANADDEYKAAQSDEANYGSSVKSYDESVNRPEFQSTLKRLGVTPDSSAAKIDDVLKNTTDEADKGILEKLKAGRESKAKFTEAQQTTADAKVRRTQAVQDTSLYFVDESAANSRAATTKAENQKITGIKKALEAKDLTEEVANEKISRIQLASTRSQQKSLDQQLRSLRTYYEKGAVGAEEFAKRERDLTVEQTNLEKQEAENRLAVQQAVLARRLKDIEFVNKKAEAAIAISSTSATTKAKEKLLSAGLTPQAQDQFALSQNQIEQKATSDRVAQIKIRIAQNKQLHKEGLKDAREFMLEEYALNQELAAAYLQQTDLKITAEEKYREAVEHNIQRIMQAEENRYKSLTSQLDFQKASLDLYNQSLERTGKLEESRYNLSKALKEAAIAPLESRLNSTNRGLDLVGKLKDTKDPSVKAAIKAQLEQMGIKQYGLTVTPATVTKSSNGNNPDELAMQIIEQKAQLEDEIATKKEEALKLEQEYQRKSLALDLQRQKIAAETAVYDAQSAQLAAAKSKLEAEGALRIAQLKKDPVAEASAKVGLEIADREIKLSDKRLNNALANLSIQDELATSAKTAQSVGQDATIKSTESANDLSRQGSALELVEAGAKAGNPMSLASAESRTRAQISPELALPRKIEINQMPKLDRGPGESIFDAYQRQRDSIPPLDKTAQMVDATKIIPQSGSNQNQFAEALKLANQDVVQRLDKLIDSMATVANTPRSLTVQTPNPVDDAAKLMNDLSRGQIVGAGL
jgi:tape measure domain-containing protein